MITVGQVREVLGLLPKVARRTLDDLLVYSQTWPTDTGVQQKLDRQGYDVRWQRRDRLHDAFTKGWEHVTVPHYKWWRQRVRMPDRLQDQYLLKRKRTASR